MIEQLRRLLQLIWQKQVDYYEQFFLIGNLTERNERVQSRTIGYCAEL